MAKMYFGPPIFDIRGKMGGSIFKKHPFSAQVVLEPLPSIDKDPTKHASLMYKQAAFRLADKFWTMQNSAWHQMWVDAVKAKRMTGYSLWMKEALPLLYVGKFAPDVPSISGGFTSYKAVEGTQVKMPCPPPTYFITLWATATFKSGWPGSWFFDISIALNYPPFGLGIDPAYWVMCMGEGPPDAPCDIYDPIPPRINWNNISEQWDSTPDAGHGPIFEYIDYPFFFDTVPSGMWRSDGSNTDAQEGLL